MSAINKDKDIGIDKINKIWKEAYQQGRVDESLHFDHEKERIEFAAKNLGFHDGIKEGKKLFLEEEKKLQTICKSCRGKLIAGKTSSWFTAEEFFDEICLGLVLFNCDDCSRPYLFIPEGMYELQFGKPKKCTLLRASLRPEEIK